MRNHAGAKNPNYRGGFAAKCPKCGKDVWVRPSRAKDARHFCGRKCQAAWMCENTTGADHWRFQGGDVERTCQACGVRFHQLRKSFNQSPGKYCSRTCAAVASRRRLYKTCELCWGEFDVRAHKTDARFCSRKCKRLSQVKERTAEDIARIRMNKRVATLMWYSLKGKKNGCKWEALAGYTCADLMRHLEALFQPGMSWENMGRWHIDHIRPQSSFSYATADDPEFKACWALTNLQPLWEIDNLRKGSKYTAPE
jgi:hypothetical protein